MLIENTLFGVVDKVQIAIERLKAFEPDDGYYLAFSGGKDSIVIKELANMSGVKYDAHYSITSVDPPELVQFIRKEHPDVIFERPGETMWTLIPKKLMPPTRMVRYCCEALKEGGGVGRTVVTGVRWAESPRRKKTRREVEFDLGGSQAKKAKENREIFLNSDNDEKRRMMETCAIKGKHILNPIIDWEDEDVWEFIRQRNLPYPSLYDKGYTRLGCIGCPLASLKNQIEELEANPKYKRQYIRTFQKMVDKRIADGFETKWKTGQDVYDWWVGDKHEQTPIEEIIEGDEK